VKHGAHVVQTGVEHIRRGDELGIDLLQHVEHFARARGGQRRQGNGVLAAEDLRLGRAVAAAGEQECLCFGDDHVGSAVVFAQHVAKLQRPTGATRVEDNDLPVAQMRRAGDGNVAVSGSGNNDHDQLGTSQGEGYVAGHIADRAEFLFSVFQRDLNAAARGDVLDVLVAAVVQPDGIAAHGHLSGHRFAAMSCPNYRDLKLVVKHGVLLSDLLGRARPSRSRRDWNRMGGLGARDGCAMPGENAQEARRPWVWLEPKRVSVQCTGSIAKPGSKIKSWLDFVQKR